MSDSAFAHAREFVQRVPLLAASTHMTADRPAVTLTFAQSLDGKIALPGQALRLSGAESMAMTHRLRALHDGILVGVDTVICDDPQLSVRQLPELELAAVAHPQPVVLDSHLRTPLTARLLTGPRSNPRLKMPVIVAGLHHDPDRRAQLERLGARVVVVTTDADGSGRLCVDAVARALRQLGILRLMVEGGARVIQAFLASPIVDLLIVTIAPTLVGERGVAAVLAPAQASIVPQLYEPFGRDIVMAATIQHQ
ncbi:2,5-diamino-6-(ribosylamino)-4(3H)-pyrimidinone 5'-phosphate reductase [Coemansia sp. RSA 2706]|nr:2,5-diamino-6-(ribosylamino)-4(3H)-pyrimidinone 5'-phosphate reductase [Coemansia sp. RSA 2711]KAJ2308678.1 2,5-diamino-6-(ribosylamino)-4(3H)-pyrimidinone 5'-phosphate reductase [Coemansia sp. RSA 2706]KAJ2315235.1 2,5-diamino-6-(ribosylamino)-4(3H)-pyrimidinone 5'-phosphate reductase [Coemansia sp. RSA 2705]KAJ2322007.1 2,5-diamino-6-(ribosylamino)-4(3H)-pyrimidinone 5'-phosphate reductase [Coemansia sp. RSA 2704]KAJ2369902.1 2,5-diamino-6-(ribosylamino)-4(3H)-pyrimidinone 5'-phosphate red